MWQVYSSVLFPKNCYFVSHLFCFYLILCHIIYFQYHLIIVWVMGDFICLIFSFIWSIPAFELLIFSTMSLSRLASAHALRYRLIPVPTIVLHIWYVSAVMIICGFLSTVNTVVMSCWHSWWFHYFRFSLLIDLLLSHLVHGWI